MFESRGTPHYNHAKALTDFAYADVSSAMFASFPYSLQLNLGPCPSHLFSTALFLTYNTMIMSGKIAVSGSTSMLASKEEQQLPSSGKMQTRFCHPLILMCTNVGFALSPAPRHVPLSVTLTSSPTMKHHEKQNICLEENPPDFHPTYLREWRGMCVNHAMSC